MMPVATINAELAESAEGRNRNHQFPPFDIPRESLVRITPRFLLQASSMKEQLDRRCFLTCALQSVKWACCAFCVDRRLNCQ
jgi:hypothetical protein